MPNAEPDQISEHALSENLGIRCAMGQLSLIEHCLCPLHTGKSLAENLVHETEYAYSVENQRKKAHVRVSCPAGLSAEDEFYLWGLLALTLAQPEPSSDFYATRHYCLRHLGKIDTAGRRGGRQYQQLATAIERLSQVSYRNDAFYDPLRGEHRRVSFGFFSYSLPLDPQSSRAWRIAWDPIFFEFCKVARSVLTFDFETYRRLDAASRRLFLLLHKLFWRYQRTPTIDVRQLGVNVLGFSPTLTPSQLMARIAHCADQLVRLRVVKPRTSKWFHKHATGHYTVRFSKGDYFDVKRARPSVSNVRDLPLFDPLHSIGFAEAEIRQILSRFDRHLVEQWTDVTLAAMEHKGDRFFRKNPQAYFLHNVQIGAQGRRTPPDWWLTLRSTEQRSQDKFGARSPEHRTSQKPTAIGDVIDALFDGPLGLSGRTISQR